MARRNQKLGWLLAFLGVGSCAVPACASVLGIEEIAPNSDGGRTGGSSGTGGSNTGGTAEGGTGGEATGGGSGTGGATEEAGTGGALGDAADTGSQPITVHGRVIDRWRHPYPGIPVQIGDVLVTTDAAGTFTIADVMPPYDVALAVSQPYSQGWSYQGLHRADPSLQVETEVFPYKYENSTKISVTNGPFPLPDGTMAKFSLGSSDGIYGYDFTSSDSGSVDTSSVAWSGPSATKATAHVLKWTTDIDAGSSGPPTAYKGYDSLDVSLTDGADVSIPLDLAKNPTIATGMVSGSISLGSLKAMQKITAYVTFPGAAAIPVVQDSGAKNTFSYLAPKLPGATMSITLETGDNYDFPYGIVHKHGILPDQAGVMLAMPDPPLQSVPIGGGGAIVSTTTDFSWTGPDTVYILSINIIDPSDNNSLFRFRVVTDKKSARIPKMPKDSGLVVLPNAEGFWFLEISGPYESMDAATGPSGLIDTFDDYGAINGPNDRDGIHIWSDGRDFKTSATP